MPPKRFVNRGKRRRGGPRGRAMMPANGARHDVKMPEPMYISPTRTTTMQFSNILIGVTNGSGIFAGYIPSDPSVTLSSYFSSAVLFTEWATFANFWNEVKVIRFEVQCCRVYTDDLKGDQTGPLAICSISSPIAVTPTTYQQVGDNGDSQLWNVSQDYSGTNRYHAVKFRSLAWATITNPNPGSSSGIAAGCPGSIVFYGAALPASTNLFYVKVRGLYRFRTRV